ncbi:MAG: SLC13 family permease [Zoogloeaceae bacterium]|nr:SLC13 family permease [Zoogloeaceae bacterium]
MHMLAVLVLTAIAFTLFAWEKLPIATTALFVLVSLVIGFTVFPYPGFTAADAFRGFGHEALVAICSLMMLGRALVVTGALEPVARQLSRLWIKHPNSSLLLTLVVCMLSSGFVNDTPIVVIMLPVLVGLALRTRQSASRLLMPMNYAVLVGGMATTIGTSTNLLVVSIAADLGLPRFGMFDFYPLVAVAAVPALLYLWLVLPRIMPERSMMMKDTRPRVFDAWLHVTEEGLSEPMTLREAMAKAGGRIQVLELRRGDLHLVRFPTVKLHAGDRLLVRDTPANLKEFEASLKFSLHDLEDNAAEKEKDKEEKEGESNKSHQQLAEIVVTDNSSLNGNTLRALRFAERFGLIVLGLRRVGREDVRQADDIATIRLQAGDVLLVQGEADALTQVKQADVLVLDGSMPLPRSEHAVKALLIMTVVVFFAATKILPIAVSAMAGVLAMIAAGCLDWREIGRALSSKIVLIVVSSLALGGALTATGGTDMLAHEYLALVRHLPPTAIMSSLMLLVALMTSFVSNNAAAAVGTPIAISIAGQLGVAAEPFVLAVLFGANFSYATPMGYQTNLLVMSAAGYRFSDFLRAGVPLLLIMWISCSLLLPIFFPL